MWTITIIAHLICNTGNNIVLRYASSDRKIDTLVLAAVTSTAVAVPAVFGIFIAEIEWGAYNTQNMPPYVFCTVIAIIYYIVYAKALEKTEASIFSFIYSFRIGFATFFGIVFLGESMTPLGMMGGALIFLAGVFLIKRSVIQPAGILFSLLSALSISLINITEKHLITVMGFATFMFPWSLITAGLMWIIVLILKRPVSKLFKDIKVFIVLMTVRCISAYGFTLSLALGAFVSIATYISSLNCVTTPIAALLILKEKENLRKKLIAGATALIGITLIFLAS